ncbi:MAG: hypothetical protein KBS86_00520 [Proteobacteria bacterium]|nr:hypothetical protein [Candidatus Enterousia scatequi]
MMRKDFYSILIGCMLPFAAFAASEGVPAYYQKATQPNANQAGYNKYQGQGYTNYVSSSSQKQVVGSRSYSYQVPVQQNNVGGAGNSGVFNNYANNSTMTTNGVAMPVDSEKKTNIYAEYSRRFADFQFETGVNSVLEWDDMVFNEITAGLTHTFTLGSFDLGVYGEYTYGSMSHGGMSMDYDLKPYDWSDPTYGIFTVSIGDESGKTHHIDFGLSAHHIWDIGGWKLSPRIGYEIFKHNLQMSNHYYPNPGVYVPLLTTGGDYVFGTVDDQGLPQYYTVPIDMAADAYGAGLDQVCLSPTDIKLANVGSTGLITPIGSTINVGDYYNVDMGTIPWGVDADHCVIIGGDGPVIVGGTTHIYETTWSGFYLGLEVEKQMTLSDKLRFYVQFGLPKYSSEGTWPNRTDWQQNPSFLDEGRNGSYSYKAEIEYDLKLSDRLQLALKADTNCYHIGKIDGEQYWAEYTEFYLNSDGKWVVETTPAYTEHITEALKSATWQSFGLYAGLKLSF